MQYGSFGKVVIDATRISLNSECGVGRYGRYEAVVVRRRGIGNSVR